MYRENSIFVDRLYGTGGSVGDTPPTLLNPALLSDDESWYEVAAADDGGPTVDVPQEAVAPSDPPYLVLPNITDGLRYKFSLKGAPNNVFWDADDEPTDEELTPTILTILTDPDSGAHYQLVFVNDPGLTIQLIPLP